MKGRRKGEEGGKGRREGKDAQEDEPVKRWKEEESKEGRKNVK